MAGLIPNDGLDYLDSVNPSSDCASWLVYLFSSNTTPANTDVVGTYTLWSTFGLGSQSGGFILAAASGGSKAFTSALKQFIASAASATNIYGWIVTNSAGTRLIYAEKFAGGPYPVTAAGYGVQGTITITDANT